MVTTASKLFLGAALAALVAAFTFGWGTGGGLAGVLTFGLRGGVGDLAGFTVLVMAASVLAVLGTVTSVLRDADPEVQAAVARLETAPTVAAPSHGSYWPVLGALCAVLAIVGIVASPVLFVIALLGAFLVTLEWMVQAWSERATGDPEVNQQIRNRLMYPIEIPVAGALIILVLVVSFSRIFLALDKNATSIIAILIGALITAGAFTIAYRPKLSKDAIAGVLVVGALVAVGAGIAAAANGPREFEVHTDEHGDEHGDESGAGSLTIDLESAQ